MTDPRPTDREHPTTDAKAKAQAELDKLLALSNRTLAQLDADSRKREWGL